jgi:hypothetical protein
VEKLELLRTKILLLVFAVLISACNTPAPTPTALPTAIPNQISQQTGSAGGTGVLMVSTTLIVGPNRFAFGIQDSGNFVKNATLKLTFFDLTGSKQQAIGTVPAIYREGPDGFTGIYTAEVNFGKAGSWGVAILGKTADGKAVDQKVGFDVLEKSTEVAVGQKAPAAKSPTADDVKGDLKKISSAPEPNPAFYKLSLDQAISSSKPTLVLFSTPAFCTSRLCGPAYDVVNSVYPTYADKLNFVHVEVYKDLPNYNPKNPQLADAMGAWGLNSEPWTYLLDKNGVVVWRVEGLVMADEVKTAVDNLLKTS